MNLGKFSHLKRSEILWIITFLTLFLFHPLFSDSLIENYGAIFLLDKATTQVYNSGKVETLIHERIKITGEKGRKFAELKIPFDSTRQRVKVITAFTKTSRGKILHVSSKNRRVVTPAELTKFAPLYPGIKTYTITFPGVEIGSIIEYKYELLTFKPLIKGHFWDGFYFQSTEPFKDSIYILKVPKGKKLLIKEFGVKLKGKMEKRGWDIYVWEKRNVPPLIPEVLMPPMEEIVPKVLISDYKNWKEIGKWFSGLFKESFTETDEIKKLVLKLTKGKNREEKIESIYNYICKNIRYVGLEMGIHGYKPHKAKKVLKFKYGDCKDKATLMVTMLKVASIESYPALINAGNKIVPGLPSPGQFNHVIVYIPKGKSYLFLDPTSEIFSFPTLPPSDENKFTLIISEKNPSLIKTPIIPARENLRKRIINASIDKDGNLYADVRIKPSGIFEAGLREGFRYLSDVERKMYLERELNKFLPGTELLSFKLKGLERLSSPFEEDYSFKTERFGIKVGEKLIFSPALIDKLTNTGVVSLKKRNYPLRFGYLKTTEEDIKYKIPESYEVETLPEEKEIREDFGYYFSKIKEENHFLVYKRILTISSYEIEQGKYEKFKKFYEGISRHDRIPAILTKNKN